MKNYFAQSSCAVVRVKDFDIRLFLRDLYKTILLIDRSGRWLALANTLLLAMQAVLPVLSLFFIKRLVELVIDGRQSIAFDALVPYIAAFCLIQFLLAAIGQLSTYYTKLQQQNLAELMGELVLHKAAEVDLEYYENPDYHDTLHLAQQQAGYKGPHIVTNVNTFIYQCASFVCLITFFLSIQWAFALVFIIAFLPISIIQWYYGYRLYWLEITLLPQERQSRYYLDILTGISHAKEVRALGFADSFISKFKKLRAYIKDETKKINYSLTLYSLLAQSAEVAVLVVFFWLLTRQAWAGSITVGVFVVYIQGFQRLQGTSKSFLQSVVSLFQQRLFLRDLFRFLNINTEKSAAEGQTFPELSTGLRVQDLSFTYPQTTRQALKNVNLECKPGQMIAIVGENGSGKSTLVKLLARLYHAQQGEITLDGVNIDDISMPEFRRKTSFLFQDFEKYFLTVTDNITLSGTEAHATVQDAATRAGAHHFIATLAKGYNTVLGRTFHESEQLSGGQWQKLAWARVFYKDARMMILDEPTSAIDAIGENDLFRRLKEEAEGRIIILISHRLYHLKVADNIYVMKDGAIAEEGNFNTLIGKEGLFKRMYESQKI